MAVKTYYWNSRKKNLLNYYKYKFMDPSKFVFRYGNAGDIFNVDLLKYLYNEKPLNCLDEGGRLLLVGSIMSVCKNNDFICGIGWKGDDVSIDDSVLESLKLYGVRGPLTKQFFENKGIATDFIKFEYDPGLLIKEVYDLDLKMRSENEVIFIPHFRDWKKYKNKYPRGIKFVSIDCNPRRLAEEILKAKVVYTSSLHGIIFSHALGKECVFVKPQSYEPIFKYQDYFLSIGQELPEPIDNIYSISLGKDKSTMLEQEIGIENFDFPSKEILRKKNIIY